MIVRQSTAVVSIGIMAGVALSLTGAQTLRALLFGVRPTDWLIHALVAAATLLVAALACWWPAWRVTRTVKMPAA